MKHLLFTLAAVLTAVFGAAGCDHPFVAEDLAGVWVRQVDEDTYRLTFQPESGWDGAEGGSFTLLSDRPGNTESGSYTLDGDVAVFQDAACQADAGEEVPGAYRLQFDRATLKIGAVDDACAARRSVLSGTWSAVDQG